MTKIDLQCTSNCRRNGCDDKHLCANENCSTPAEEKVVLNGRTVQVCQEHKRTTDLGNWQGIIFA